MSEKKKIVAGQRETRTKLKYSAAKTGTVWAKKIFNDSIGL